ncbi:hypothetical protein [Photobacterium kishitanii]|uniref:Uncharacterized protein n=1 Tax=Photobacterium kishitanii TaxID=318456 RepID=A0A2T3KM88_9GAMM|nr:hypothetical protein [Photobacterium kishitanii]PSV00894.1 hypothetical protein C9J27_02385 [Photobacterium kishitanii]
MNLEQVKTIVTNGISFALDHGYNEMSFEHTTMFKTSRKPHGYNGEIRRNRRAHLSPNNPLHFQLFELFKLKGVIVNVSTKEDDIIIEAKKTSEVKASFFSEGFYRLSKS